MSHNDLQARADAVLAKHGRLTFSKSHQYYTDNVAPVINDGHGQYLVTVDGQSIFDCNSALGSNLIYVENNYSLPTVTEIEAAEQLLRHITIFSNPRVQFVKSGTEACMAACRWARAYTGRTGIHKLGYSGWSTEMIGAEQPGVGCIPTDVTKYDTLPDLISSVTPDIAAVLLEPVQLDEYVSDDLRRLRKVCSDHNVLLIFDETITGYRYLHYCVAQAYGIKPDMMILGKALGGGYPLGVVIGEADILNTDNVFVSGTFCGETNALDHAMRTMAYVSPDLLRLHWDMSHDWQRKMQYVCSGKIHYKGYGMRIVMEDDNGGRNRAALSALMYRDYHILFGPLVSIFPRLSWSETEYGNVLSAVQSCIGRIETVRFETLPRPAFKR